MLSMLIVKYLDWLNLFIYGQAICNVVRIRERIDAEIGCICSFYVPDNTAHYSAGEFRRQLVGDGVCLEAYLSP